MQLILMVIMTSGIARGRVRTTATTTMTESRNTAAIYTPNNRLKETCSLGLRCTSLILGIHVMINWYLSKQGIRWPLSRDHIAGSSSRRGFGSWPLTKCWFLIGSRAHLSLTCWKQGRIFQKPVKANPELKISRIITFSSIQIFFPALFRVYSDY